MCSMNYVIAICVVYVFVTYIVELYEKLWLQRDGRIDKLMLQIAVECWLIWKNVTGDILIEYSWSNCKEKTT